MSTSRPGARPGVADPGASGGRRPRPQADSTFMASSPHPALHRIHAAGSMFSVDPRAWHLTGKPSRGRANSTTGAAGHGRGVGDGLAGPPLVTQRVGEG